MYNRYTILTDIQKKQINFIELRNIIRCKNSRAVLVGVKYYIKVSLRLNI